MSAVFHFLVKNPTIPNQFAPNVGNSQFLPIWIFVGANHQIATCPLAEFVLMTTSLRATPTASLLWWIGVVCVCAVVSGWIHNNLIRRHFGRAVWDKWERKGEVGALGMLVFMLFPGAPLCPCDSASHGFSPRPISLCVRHRLSVSPTDSSSRVWMDFNQWNKNQDDENKQCVKWNVVFNSRLRHTVNPIKPDNENDLG